MGYPRLKFYDISERKGFSTDDYNIEKDVNGRDRAVAYSPSGQASYHYVGKSFVEKYC